MTRVGNEDVRGFAAWSRRAQAAVTVQAVRVAGAVQIVRRVLRPSQWPFVLIPPYILAHNENTHRRFFQQAVRFAFEPVVKPAQVQPVQARGQLRR